MKRRILEGGIMIVHYYKLLIGDDNKHTSQYTRKLEGQSEKDSSCLVFAPFPPVMLLVNIRDTWSLPPVARLCSEVTRWNLRKNTIGS